MKLRRDNIVIISLICLHLILGIGSSITPLVAKLWGIAPILLGTFFIVKNRNRRNEAVYWTAYYTGLEVLLRVTGGTLGYEMGKYSAIFFLVLGAILNPGPRKNNIWLLYIILLIPGLFITDWSTNNIGELVRFTLSGPILIAVSAYYFSGREIDWEDYKKILRNFILPLFALVVVLTLKTPDFSSINFTSRSNFATSGGFSPVHISSVLGIGLLILLLSVLLKMNIMGFRWLEIVIWALILFRALLTFSRSGIYAALAVGLFMLLWLIQDQQIRQQLIRYMFFGLVAIALAVGVWSKVNTVTGGMAYNRYTGRNTAGIKMQDITSNRTILIKQDIDMFLDNPIFGIGVGMTPAIRNKMYHNNSSSHTEYTRLLSEHGLFGIVVLYILVRSVVVQFRRTEGYSKLFFILFAGYSLIIMFPASTRTALPLFLYGLSFITITEE